jgi:hypothetical protein
MPRTLAALAVLTFGSACLATGETDEESPDPGDPAHVGTHAVVQLEDPESDICAHLPPAGACAQLCDRDALLEHVPAGSCAVFHCELTDGRAVGVHVCRPED